MQSAHAPMPAATSQCVETLFYWSYGTAKPLRNGRPVSNCLISCAQVCVTPTMHMPLYQAMTLEHLGQSEKLCRSASPGRADKQTNTCGSPVCFRFPSKPIRTPFCPDCN